MTNRIFRQRDIIMKKTSITILILLVTFVAYGQKKDSTTANQWSIGLGYQNFRLFDKNVSPLIYVSNNGGISFEYEKEKTKRLWNIGIFTSLGNMQSKRFGKREAIIHDPYNIQGTRDSVVYEINPGLSFINVSLYYSNYWKLNTNKHPMSLGVIIKDNFFYGALGADVWFFNQLSIMPAYRLEFVNNSKSYMNAEISTPIFSYLIRQPYSLDPSLPESSYFKANVKTGSSLGAMNRFQQLNVKLNYQYTLTKRNQIGLAYYFTWMNYSNIPDRPLRAYSNAVLITYTF